MALTVHSNPTMKLKRFQAKIDKLTCDENESTALLCAYYQSKLWKERNSENETDKKAIYSTIGENLCQVINNETEKSSPIRAPLMQIASRNVPISTLGTVINYSRVTLSKYKNMTWKEVMTKYCDAKFRRERISTDEINEIREFLLESCPTPSGEKRTIKISPTERRPRHNQAMSDEALYQLYVARFTALVNRTEESIISLSYETTHDFLLGQNGTMQDICTKN